MDKHILGFVACLALFAYADAHYYMEEPIMRASLYRENSHFEKNVNAPEWCEVVDRATNKVLANDRNATCGVAGPVYNNDPTKDVMLPNCNPRGCTEQKFRSVEYGSEYYVKGYLVKNYFMGETVTVKFVVQASHGGRVSFSLCEVGKDGKDPSVDCFEKKESKLKVKSAFSKKAFKKHYYTFPSDTLESKFTRTLSLQLPEGVHCNHCILRYKVDKTFPPKTKQYDLNGKRMKNQGQIYVGAADIMISVRGG